MAKDLQPTQGVKVFISYSYKDERYTQKLLDQLSFLRRKGIITPWYDAYIVAGHDRDEERYKHFNEAEIIICLLSPDFIGSDYYSLDMQRAWERKKVQGVEIVPILLRSIDCEQTPFDGLQFFPRSLKPIVGRGANQDQGFCEVSKEIKAIVLRKRQSYQ